MIILSSTTLHSLGSDELIWFKKSGFTGANKKKLDKFMDTKPLPLPSTNAPVAELPQAMYDPNFARPPEIAPLSTAALARKEAITRVAKMPLVVVKSILTKDFAVQSVEYSAAASLRKSLKEFYQDAAEQYFIDRAAEDANSEEEVDVEESAVEDAADAVDAADAEDDADAEEPTQLQDSAPRAIRRPVTFAPPRRVAATSTETCFVCRRSRKVPHVSGSIFSCGDCQASCECMDMSCGCCPNPSPGNVSLQLMHGWQVMHGSDSHILPKVTPIVRSTCERAAAHLLMYATPNMSSNELVKFWDLVSEYWELHHS